MPLYYFRVQSGHFSGADDHGTDLADDNVAWEELRRVSGDLLGSVARNLRTKMHQRLSKVSFATPKRLFQ